jgi:Uma2 family endonuclease
MATLVTDPFIEGQLRAQRALSGIDRYDEVWEGMYIIAPAPNNEHQRLVVRLTWILENVVSASGLGEVFTNVNVSDREIDWLDNFREPDAAVVLKGSRAKDCGTHFYGGPDFLIEIISPGDRGRNKLEFYGKIGVRELMIIDRDPWRLELYQLQDGELRLAGKSRVDDPTVVPSNVLPLSFRLIPGDSRPQIEVTHRDGVQRWIA